MARKQLDMEEPEMEDPGGSKDEIHLKSSKEPE